MCRSCWCTASARRRFRERAGMRFKIIAMVIALSAALVSARVAAAHTPIFIEREITSPDTAWPVDDYAISWAFYGRVTPAGVPQYFAIDGRAGERLYATLEVPEIAGLQEFRPSLALIGPGLPAFDAPRGVTLPAESGGVRMDDARSAPHARCDEPFSRTRCYRGPEIDRQRHARRGARQSAGLSLHRLHLPDLVSARRCPLDDRYVRAEIASPSSTHPVQIERGVSFLSGASDGSTTAGHPIHVRSLGHAGAHRSVR